VDKPDQIFRANAGSFNCCSKYAGSRDVDSPRLINNLPSSTNDWSSESDSNTNVGPRVRWYVVKHFPPICVSRVHKNINISIYFYKFISLAIGIFIVDSWLTMIKFVLIIVDLWVHKNCISVFLITRDMLTSMIQLSPSPDFMLDLHSKTKRSISEILSNTNFSQLLLIKPREVNLILSSCYTSWVFPSTWTFTRRILSWQKITRHFTQTSC
jgi:hypothetical protein